MYLHIDDARPEPDSIESAISRREAVILSLAAHVVLLVLVIWLPALPFMHRLMQAANLEVTQPVRPVRPDEDRAQPFVMVDPRIDREALRAIERPAPPSDLDRSAQTRERPPDATNPQPFSRGNSPEFVEAERQAARARGQGPSPEPAPPQPPPGGEQTSPAPAGQGPGIQERQSYQGQNTGATGRPAPPPGGALGEALQNLSRYARSEQLDNRGGGMGEFGPQIQFDTKGVEFGPWIRRFVAQVKRNWFIPMAAQTLRGHVVLTFNVHRDGRITDLQVAKPSNIEAFNKAAFNALAASSPTMPLPPEYPSDTAFFTVTFYYNESPQSP